MVSIASSAQVDQTRFELPLHPNQNEPFHTIALGDDGMLLYGLFIGKETNAIEVTRLDTTFRQVWKGYIAVDRNLYVLATKYYDDQIFILMKDRFNPFAEFSVIVAQIETGNYVMRPIKTLLAFQPTYFTVTKEAALIGGYFNYRPLVLYYSFAKDQSKMLPGFYNDTGELDQIRADDNGNIDIVVSGKNMVNRRRSLWIRNYDRNGDLVKTIFLQPDDDKNLIFGRSVGQPGGNQIVCGVYGRYSEYSRGVFVANIDPYGEYTIKYYNYGDLERFFNYMKARRERRVKDRIERKKVRGHKIKFNYRLMVNDFLPYGNQFVMLGEAFYPHYSYPNQRNMGTSYWMNGRSPTLVNPMFRGDLVFDGYQYTHAVVIGFDKAGNLKWDNSFEINDVRTMQLEQFVKIHPEKDKISLLYLFDNVIRTKVIKDTDILEGKSYNPLETGSPDDFLKDRDTQQAKLEYWYGDVFYATGIQNVRNKKDDGANIARRVFFINKIAPR
jgi:hypothetical protein